MFLLGLKVTDVVGVTSTHVRDVLSAYLFFRERSLVVASVLASDYGSVEPRVNPYVLRGEAVYDRTVWRPENGTQHGC